MLTSCPRNTLWSCQCPQPSSSSLPLPASATTGRPGPWAQDCLASHRCFTKKTQTQGLARPAPTTQCLQAQGDRWQAQPGGLGAPHLLQLCKGGILQVEREGGEPVAGPAAGLLLCSSTQPAGLRDKLRRAQLSTSIKFSHLRVVTLLCSSIPRPI